MKVSFKRINILLLMLLVTVVACSNTEKSNNHSNSLTNHKEEIELIISAAASLKDAMDEIQQNYELEHDHIVLNFNFGSSGSLQQQISQGAPADLFFSAAESKFTMLVEEGIINKEDGVNLLQNSLVLIVPKGEQLVDNFEDLSNNEIYHISIGTPETVPAGNYAKESLEKMDLWGELEEKIVYAKDVRQVLSYVETGNVDVGIVYKTDAQVSDLVEVVAEADPSTHPSIIYPVGMIKESKNYEEVNKFYEYLQTDIVLKVFDKYGFTAY